MQFPEIDPFVRYVGHQSALLLKGFPSPLSACDHRLFVPERGELTLLANGEKYTLTRGSVLFVRAGVTYRYLSCTPDLSMYSFNFDLTKRYAHMRTPIRPRDAKENSQTTLEGDRFPTELPASFAVCVDNAPTIAAEIEKEYRLAYLYFEMRTGHLLADLLTVALRRHLSPDSEKLTRTVSEITDFIRKHYAEPLDNAAIARYFSYHPNHINRLLTEQTGMSLHAYLCRTRISRALELLTNSDLSVTEVGLAVGFGDAAHFSRTFRKQVGVTPSAYRKRK